MSERERETRQRASLRLSQGSVYFNALHVCSWERLKLIVKLCKRSPAASF